LKVPLIDLQAELKGIETELLSALEETAKSGRYVLGPAVEKLESELAGYLGAEHAVGVSSGTDALLISLMALETGPGDLVITTPFSFFATAGAIVRTGATPVFIDIEQDTFNLDPAALYEWFDNNPDLHSKVKAILPVHLYGQSADMKPILKLAEQYTIPVVEDAAQAIGSSYNLDGEQRMCGSMGTLGCFSFFPTKNLGCLGDGGLVTCNDSSLRDKLVALRNHGSYERYYHKHTGGNFRLDAIQAAVLQVKLPHLEKWHSMRRENAAYYTEQLNQDLLKTPRTLWGQNSHIFNQYVILVPEKRDELRGFLADNDIYAEIYYLVPFHLQECFKDLGYKQGDFPLSEDASARCLALPIYPEITTEMQNYVVSKIEEFYAK